MNWNKLKMVLLNDSPTAFPTGVARFVNVSAHLMLLQIGDPRAQPSPKIFGVPVDRVIQKPIQFGNNQIRVGYLDKGNQKKWIWSGEVNVAENQRLQAFVYKAENTRHPVLFHFATEVPPEVPENP
jgi:hypothetical protein